MNDRERNRPDAGRDHEWTARLARLRTPSLAAEDTPNGGEKLPGSLAERARRLGGPLYGMAARFYRIWETALVAIVFLLLAWDLLRAIRLLLG